MARTCTNTDFPFLSIGDVPLKGIRVVFDLLLYASENVNGAMTHATPGEVVGTTVAVTDEAGVFSTPIVPNEGGEPITHYRVTVHWPGWEDTFYMYVADVPGDLLWAEMNAAQYPSDPRWLSHAYVNDILIPAELHLVQDEVDAVRGDPDYTPSDTNYFVTLDRMAEVPPGAGTNDHTLLINREAADQHPIGATTGLTAALAGKEPVITPKNTAFNKNLGTGAGTVSEGNHLHTGVYDPVGSAGTVQGNLDTHTSDLVNPHAVTKAQVGLGNVDNTADADKPTSVATQATLDLKADLIAGVVPTSQIPSIALTEYLGEAVSEVAMLALVGERGDWCTRTDTGTNWTLTAEPSSLLANWVQMLQSDVPVTSVNAQTGDIVLGFADVGADQSGSAAAVQGNLDTHKSSADHDGRYYTEAEVDASLAGKVSKPATSVVGELASFDSITGAIIKGGPASFGGDLSTKGNTLLITNGLGEIQGVLVHAADGGVTLAYSIDGSYDPANGSFEAHNGIAHIHGTTTYIAAIDADDGIEYEMHVINGVPTYAPLPAPGWSDDDTGVGEQALSTIGAWVAVNKTNPEGGNGTVTAIVAEDVAAGDPLVVAMHIFLTNASATSTGTVSLGWGLDGADPSTAVSSPYIVGGFSELLVAPTVEWVTHGGLTAGQTLTLFARRTTESNVTFAPSIDGAIGTHKIKINVPAAAGATDNKDVKISVGDTAAGFLGAKLVLSDGSALDTEDLGGGNLRMKLPESGASSGSTFTALGTVIDASTTALPAGVIRSDYTATGPASGTFTLNITHSAAAGKAMAVFVEVDNTAGASLGIQVNGVDIPTADWNITPSWGVKFRFEVYVSTSGIHNATWDKVGD